MKNRGIIARLKAKAKKKGKTVKKDTKPSEPPILKGVLLKDPESGKVVDRFVSMEDAVEAGFNKLNIIKALKNKTKYKGHLWEESK